MHEDREKHMANLSPGHVVAADNCDFNPSFSPTRTNKHEGSVSGVDESVEANFNRYERTLRCVFLKALRQRWPPYPIGYAYSGGSGCYTSRSRGEKRRLLNRC